MRTCINFIITGSLILIFSSCSQTSTKWQKYTSTDGSFSISMPVNAQKYDKVEMTQFGKQTVHYLTWKPSTFALDRFKLFQVSYTDCPKDAIADTNLINATLDASMNERKKDFTEIDAESQRIEINGYPGRSFIYAVPRDYVTTIVKECIAGNKKYDIIVIAKRNYPTNAELTVFFNSFQILR